MGTANVFAVAPTITGAEAPKTDDKAPATPQQPAQTPQQTTPQTPEKPAAVEQTKTDDKKPADLTIQQDAQKVAEDKGIDLNKYEAEFTEKGELSEVSYKELEKKGLSRDHIDRYISGQQQLVKQFHSELFESVGGEQQYWEMAQWAATGLTKGEQTAYNKVLKSNDPEAIKLAVAGLSSKFSKANGNPPRLVGGSRGPAVQSFRSMAEVTAAMADPRYRTDAAYRSDVAERLKSTDF